MKNLGPAVPTLDGSFTLRHPTLGECYHSSGGALWESRNLYGYSSGYRIHVDSSKKAVCVLDVGLGLGYNACTAIDLWTRGVGNGTLHLVSLESNRDLIKALISGCASWQKKWPKEWLDWLKNMSKDGQNRYQCIVHHPSKHSNATCLWEIYCGCALGSIELFSNRSMVCLDFVFQDPFSPEKNPNLWTTKWFTNLHQISRRGAILATYSVANKVRTALSDSGWIWKKVPPPSPGPKKHWLLARRT